MFGGYIG